MGDNRRGDPCGRQVGSDLTPRHQPATAAR